MVEGSVLTGKRQTLHLPDGWTELKHWHRKETGSKWAYGYWLVIWEVLRGKPGPGVVKPVLSDYALQGEAWALDGGWVLCQGERCDFWAEWLARGGA